MGPFKAKHIGEDKGKVREPRGICMSVHTGNSVCKEVKHRGTHSKSRTSNFRDEATLHGCFVLYRRRR